MSWKDDWKYMYAMNHHESSEGECSRGNVWFYKCTFEIRMNVKMIGYRFASDDGYVIVSRCIKLDRMRSGRQKVFSSSTRDGNHDTPLD